MFNKLKIAAMAALFSTAIVSDVQALDWYRWRGPDLNGISKETGWKADAANNPKILWKAEVGMGFASFSVSEGRFYTSGNASETDTVYCFDANTGKEIWKQSYACGLDAKYYEGGTSATPTVDGKNVYTLSKRGHLYSFDAATGKINWSKNIAEEVGAKLPTWGYASSPLVEGDLLVVNVNKAGVAVDKATGNVVWKTEPDAAGYASAVPFDNEGKRALAFFGKETLFSVEPKTGQILWQHPWKTQYDVNAADPIFNGNQVFLSSSYGKGCTLVEFKGGQTKEVYMNKNMMNHFNSCVLLDGFLYGVTGQSGKTCHLICLEWKTGEIKWQEASVGLGSLMAADGKLIVLGAKGELIIAKAQTTAFEAISRGQILGGKCWTVPVLANGKIYARNAAGNVVCVEAK
ncbi:MAG: PQQ-binding-like beta-propeller repeat protein [Verrucomicrobiota bacterium]